MTLGPLPSPWLALALVVLTTASQTSAQVTTATDPASAPLDLEAHALPEPSEGPRVAPEAVVAAPSASSRAVPWNARRAKRGAFLAGFGAATAMVSVTTVLGFGRPGWCYDREPSYSVTARYWGSVAAGLGGAMAITGAGLLLSQPRSVRVAHRETRARGIHAPGKALLGFALGMLASAAFVWAPSIGEAIGCSNS